MKPLVICWCINSAFVLLGAGAMVVGCALKTPELLTPRGIAAVVLALVAVQPLQLGLTFVTSLLRSAILRMFLLSLSLYAMIGLVAGTFALGYFVSLTGATLLTILILAGGWGIVEVARRKWMRAELG